MSVPPPALGSSIPVVAADGQSPKHGSRHDSCHGSARDPHGTADACRDGSHLFALRIVDTMAHGYRCMSPIGHRSGGIMNRPSLVVMALSVLAFSALGIAVVRADPSVVAQVRQSGTPPPP